MIASVTPARRPGPRNGHGRAPRPARAGGATVATGPHVLRRLLPNWSGTARKLLLGFGALDVICATASYLTLAGLGRIQGSIERMRREEEGVRLALELASAVRDQYAHQAHTI